MKVLFVDACPREKSRTRRLAEVLIEKLAENLSEKPNKKLDEKLNEKPNEKSDENSNNNLNVEVENPNRNLNVEIERISINDKNLPEVNEKALSDREKDFQNNDFDKEIYKYARQFAAADVVIFAAPYWDLSFPAILKKYIEAITVNGITFVYSEDGRPTGLCNAEKLYFVTTSGGPIINEEFGYGYIKAMAQGMYGINECKCVSAQNLDIAGNDAEAILAEAMDEVRKQKL